MNRTKLALAVSAALFTSSALATNGTNLIGVGTQAKALGGTGVAAFYSAENVLVNPAVIGKAAGTEFTFGGTIFMPSVSNDTGNGAGFQTSAANLNLIPSVSLASRINNNWTFGIGMFGTSGMGVDYIDSAAPGHMQAQSNMQVMRFAPTLTYNTENFAVGVSPVIQYGSLDVNYDMGGMMGYNQIGSGMASDLGYGFDIGTYFDVSKNTTIALAYQSAINMKYGKVLESASQPFFDLGMVPRTFGNELEQPAEMKVGIAHQIGKYTISADYKQVQWSAAKGYKDFGWQDQSVIALGTKYNGNGYWVGAGYNKADNPIKPMNTAIHGGGATNFFNNLFFPATTEQHITLGGGYKLNKHTMLEGAVVMATESKTAVDVTGAVMGGSTTNTTKHSQTGYTVSVKYNF